MEYLDILDEQGNITGKTEERKIVHEQGLWHYHVGIWIMNKQGELLFQKRAITKKRNPNKWGRTGGHVDAGEAPVKGIIREIKEEIGIDLKEEQLELIEIEKEVNIDEKIINRNFVYNYFALVDYPIEEYIIQKEELSEVKYMTIEEMEERRKEKDYNYTFSSWDEENFKKHIKWLKDRREKI